MAGVTSNVTFPIRELAVDIARHGQHHPRGFLLWIVVTGEIALHVTKAASLTERRCERTHRHLELFRSIASQNLQILRRRKRVWTLSTLFLGAEADGEQQSNC